MTTLGVSLIWCALQATVFTLAGGLVYCLARRRGPAAASLAASGTLIVLVCVSLLAFSPWPRWYTLAARPAKASTTTDDARAAPGEDHVPETVAGKPAEAKRTAAGVSVAERWEIFWEELRRAPAARKDEAAGSQAARWRWPAIVAGVFLLGVMLTAARIAVGLIALRRYRKQMLPVENPTVIAEARELARRIGVCRPIEVRQSATLFTPATIGWLRPVVMLPVGWQDWTEAERRVVLAHEIAHVARGDYLAWLLAQCSLALHFYHPLVYWLTRRLKLEQELAADAWGAELAGGRETYLLTLAHMALRQDDRRVAWAARGFLPTRGAFLRRLEMLSETKRLRNVALSRTRAAGLVALLALFGLAVSGIRGPIGTSPLAQAAQPDKPQALAAGAHEPISLEFVPPRSVAVLGLRPSALLGRPGMKGLADVLNDFPRGAGLEKLRIEDLEEVIYALADTPQPRQSPERILLTVMRSKQAFDWKPYAKSLLGEGEPVAVKLGDKTYYHSAMAGYHHPEGTPEVVARRAYYLPDDRTIVFGLANVLRPAITASDREKPAWAADWQKFATGEAAAMVDVAVLNNTVGAELRGEQAPPQVAAQLAALSALAPLWEKSQRLFLSGSADQGFSVVGRIDCLNGDDARQVEQTAGAALTLSRNMLEELGNKLAAAPTAKSDSLPLLDLASGLLKSGKLTTEGAQVKLTAQLDLDVAETAIAAAAPAVKAARAAALRAHATNNMKQIMIALHNYADVHGHFPPPVLIGPDGKTPHSWRVAILPYIEQQELYRQYKLDEPWDSENNKRVLAQMPATLRDPSAATDSTETAYFGLVGAHAAFGEKNGKGTKFQDITDGTSNTIMLVEAKRAVPWTKPEDIEFDPNQPPPKLGGLRAGGFLNAFADGSVHFFPDNFDPQLLRKLMTKDGGESAFVP